MEDPPITFLPKTPSSKDDEGVEAFVLRRFELHSVQQPPVEEGDPMRWRKVGEADGRQHPEPHLPGEHTFTSEMPCRLLLLVAKSCLYHTNG